MAIQVDILEKSLVQACLEGDSKSQENLYKRFSPILYSICLRYCKNAENAQDVLQEVFIKIFQNMHLFRFEGSFEGWLKKLAVRHCLDYNKKLHREPFSEDISEVQILSTSETAIESLQAKDLYKILQTMPAGYRMVFNLYAIEGYSHQEIATELGINENTSKSQLHKARKYLQQVLQTKELQ